jgi:hypothetical protein
MRAYPKGGGARATRQRHDPQGLLTIDEAVDETRIRALFFGDVACSVATEGAGATATCTRRAKLQLLHPESQGCTQGDRCLISEDREPYKLNFDEYTLASRWVRACWLLHASPVRLRAPAAPSLSDAACVATGHRDATCLPDRTERKPRRRRPSSQSLPPGLGGHAARARDMTQMRRRTND